MALLSTAYGLTAAAVKQAARDCGFELSGITPAEPIPEAFFFDRWVSAGMAGQMMYLTGDRAAIRHDPRHLLPSARSILCVGKLYNTPVPYSINSHDPLKGWIARYAFMEDYHHFLRRDLERVIELLREKSETAFEARAVVDTAPLLERAYARRAGLGWIGRNTCLINEPLGSWFLLGEILLSLDLAPDAPPPDRCGSCTRCIEACPTNAIVPVVTPEGPQYTLDSRLCISYFTIELKDHVPREHRAATGNQIFGCDICQDVCPWNRAAPVSAGLAADSAMVAPPLEDMAALSAEQFRKMFRHTPVWRSKYKGFLRNVAIAMGNAGSEHFRAALERLAVHEEELVGEAARWALTQL